MLGWRLLVSAILIPAFVFLFYLDQRAGESAPVLLALAWRSPSARLGSWSSCFACAPSSRVLLRRQFALVCDRGLGMDSPSFGRRARKWPSIARLATPMVVFTLSVLWLLASNAARYREPGDRMETLGAELLIVCYVGVLLSLTAELRWVAGAKAGYLVLGSLIVAAKSGDIGAYTLGRLIGNRKMCPCSARARRGPGAVGALIASALGGWLWLGWAPPYFDTRWTGCPAVWSVVYGA